jgi:HK97 family phage major capsid protein
MSIEAIRDELSGVLHSARAIAERAERENRDFTGAEKARVDRLLTRAKGLRSEIDQERARDRGSDDRLSKRVNEIGAMFGTRSFRGDGSPSAGSFRQTGGFAGSGQRKSVWADAFEREVKGRSAAGSKALMSPSGAVSVPGVISGLTPVSEKVDTILQLIPWNPVGGTDAVSYLRETERTHNAEAVADGERKPTSVYTVQRIDDRVRTIAHLSESIPRHYLADIVLLREYLEMVLREGYELELENQILSGDGTGENFTGILNTAGIQLVTFAGDVLQTARRAITALEVQSITPGAYVFHPEDWETFELLTETSGAYLLQDGTRAVPVDRARRRLWGYPVALSLGISEGTGLLVDWAGSSQGWERDEVEVDWSEAFHVPAGSYDLQDSTGFETNQMKFRAEGRAFFAMKRPHGAVEIELEAGS